MRSYLGALDERLKEEENDGDIELNLSINGNIDQSELERLARLARRVPPNGCIVEAGSFFDRAWWALAQNAQLGVSVYCLDSSLRESWMAPIEEEKSGETLSIETLRRSMSGLTNVIPLQGRSPMDFVGWQRPIDMFFENSARTNPALHQDLTFWVPLVQLGGCICGHGYSEQFPDVQAEVDRLAAALQTEPERMGTLWSIRVPDNPPATKGSRDFRTDSQARVARARASAETSETPSRVGMWNEWYEKGERGRAVYADPRTAEIAGEWLNIPSIMVVEDWGCGYGGFKRYLGAHQTYIGIDGSNSPFAHKMVDLVEYRSKVDGIHLRHVLEHNPSWREILRNLLSSFTKRAVITLFTPFCETETVIARYPNFNNTGVDMVDISLSEKDLYQFFSEASNITVQAITGLVTDSQYNIEHVYLLARG
jgi:hypothetical protein